MNKIIIAMCLLLFTSTVFAGDVFDKKIYQGSKVEGKVTVATVCLNGWLFATASNLRAVNMIQVRDSIGLAVKCGSKKEIK